MGLAAPIAFGVALAQPARKVFALEGDGSILMELGCLATIAAQGPKNLCIIIWDNGVYQITGGQGTPAAAASPTRRPRRARSAWPSPTGRPTRMSSICWSGRRWKATAPG